MMKPHRTSSRLPSWTSPAALLVWLWCGSASVEAASVSTGFDKIAQPFLSEHCVRCHGEKKQKGDLQPDSLAQEFTEEPRAAVKAKVETLFGLTQ